MAIVTTKRKRLNPKVKRSGRWDTGDTVLTFGAGAAKNKEDSSEEKHDACVHTRAICKICTVRMGFVFLMYGTREKREMTQTNGPPGERRGRGREV